MFIRPAVATDAHAIADLHADSWRKHYRGVYRDAYLDELVYDDRRQLWHRRFQSPAADQQVLVAERNNELAGFVCAFAHADAHWGTLLDNLHVHSTQQSAGIGASLLRAVMAWTHAADPACGLYLWVLEHNTRAQAFYQRHGAHEADDRVSEAPGGGLVKTRRYVWSHEQLIQTAST